jgi:hypothetical protein
MQLGADILFCSQLAWQAKTQQALSFQCHPSARFIQSLYMNGREGLLVGVPSVVFRV